MVLEGIVTMLRRGGLLVVLVGILRLVVAMLLTGIIPRVLVAISFVGLWPIVGYPTCCTGRYPTSFTGVSF